MPLPLDPDDDLEAAGYRCAGPQLAGCGHGLDRGEVLVELTYAGQPAGTMCTGCFAAVGHRVAVTSGAW